jgi:hypothetical protein
MIGRTVCVEGFASVMVYTPDCISDDPVRTDPRCYSNELPRRDAGTNGAPRFRRMTDREAKTRAVKILAKSIYRDLEAQGFDEKQIVALATELISEVTTKISTSKQAAQQVA